MINPFVHKPGGQAEGDAWYERNKDALAKYCIDTDPVHQVCWNAIKDNGIKHFVDYGCSSGERLVAFCHTHDGHGVGIDVSSKALGSCRTHSHHEEWNGETGRFRWMLGQRENLCYLKRENGEWAKNKLLLTMIFVWHWIPREELIDAINTVTWFCKPGDYLCIGDFDAKECTRRQYHHLPGQDVWTWKAPYNRMFTITGLWREEHGYCAPHTDHVRSYWLLKRVDPKEGYAEEVTPPLPPQSSP